MGITDATIVLTGGNLRGIGNTKISFAGIVTAELQQRHWTNWIGSRKTEEVVGNMIRVDTKEAESEDNFAKGIKTNKKEIINLY